MRQRFKAQRSQLGVVNADRKLKEGTLKHLGPSGFLRVRAFLFSDCFAYGTSRAEPGEPPGPPGGGRWGGMVRGSECRRGGRWGGVVRGSECRRVGYNAQQVGGSRDNARRLHARRFT